MNSYFESNRNDQNIRCKLYAESNAEIEKVVIFCHGFAGHKDSGAAQTFADKVLSAYPGVAVLIFNWPAHGEGRIVCKYVLHLGQMEISKTIGRNNDGK